MKKIFIKNKQAISGATTFFRNRVLLEVVLDYLASHYSHCKILFHSCSVGAEPYSLLIANELRKTNRISLQIHATDKFQQYLDMAAEGIYSKEDLSGLQSEELDFFTRYGDMFKVSENIRKMIHFLPAVDFREFQTIEKYEAVFILNSLCYVSRKDQAHVFKKISEYNTDLLVTSAYHQHSIKKDMVQNQYRPILDKQEEIHSAWLHRHRKQDSILNTLGIALNDLIKIIRPPKEGGLHTINTIPPYTKVKNFEYKNTSLFSKRSQC